MITYQLHLIRHAQTEANREGLFLGQTDVPISEQGRQEVYTYLEKFDYPAVQKVYVSPLLRCRQTAEILYPDHLTKIIYDLQECDFGDMEGKTMEQLKESESLKSFLNDGFDYHIQNGESGQEFLARVVRGLEEIFQDMMEKKVTRAACITHGGVITMLMCALAVPQKEASFWMPQNATGYTILFTPSMWMRDKKIEAYSYNPIPKEENGEWKEE